MTLEPDGFVEVMMPRGLTPRAKRVVNEAQTLAIDRGHKYVGVEHLLLALLDSDPSLASAALDRCGVDQDSLRTALSDLMGSRAENPEGGA